MHYTTHTTNVETHRRVVGYIGKYDTLLEMVKKRKVRCFGHVVSTKITMTKTILQGKLEGKGSRGRFFLRWMCGVTRRDQIRNEHIRGTTRVVHASKKITEKQLKWPLDVDIPGKRRRDGPNLGWKDAGKRDMRGGVERGNDT